MIQKLFIGILFFIILLFLFVHFSQAVFVLCADFPKENEGGTKILMLSTVLNAT